MQEAVPVGVGAMAAILGLSDEQVARGLRARVATGPGSVREVVDPANFNAPSQVVIAGHKAAVDRACAAAKALGAKRAVLLPVSAPFHSSLLAPAGAQLQRALADIDLRSPRMPLVNNIDVAVETDPRADQGCAGAPGLRTGSLGGGGAGAVGAGRRPLHRVRPRQGPERPGRSASRPARGSMRCMMPRRWSRHWSRPWSCANEAADGNGEPRTTGRQVQRRQAGGVLAGEVALVTGASRGIGEAIALGAGASRAHW